MNIIDKFVCFVTNDNELNGKYNKLLSLMFLSVAGAMCFLEFTVENMLGWDTTFSFYPTAISSIVAIFLIAPLYLRGILMWNKSIYAIISLIAILLLFASFIELAVGGNRANNIIYSLIAMSLVLSWLGIQSIAGISWVLTFAAAMYAVIVSNIALGFYGFVYIGSGFIGLVLHSGLNPGQLTQGLKSEFYSSTKNISGKMKGDINAAIEKI